MAKYFISVSESGDKKLGVVSESSFAGLKYSLDVIRDRLSEVLSSDIFFLSEEESKAHNGFFGYSDIDILEFCDDLIGDYEAIPFEGMFPNGNRFHSILIITPEQ